jgi:small ligand-binding sensory domain FIST
MRGTQRFGVGLSRAADPVAAADEACAAAAAMLGDGAPATLVVMFASPDLCAQADRLLARVHASLAPEHLIGSMGEAIIAEGLEIEEGPALVVWAARLPGVEVIPFRLVARPVGEGMGVLGWPDAITDAPPDTAGPVLMLADPFSFPADGLLTELHGEPAAPVVVGGMASGGQRPGEHCLFAGTDVLFEGAVAVGLSGSDTVTVVSQACMPIGPEMVVTKAEGSSVLELAGMPALQKLEEVVDALDPAERALAVKGLMAGLVIDENTPDYERGNFLVRPIHGGDRDSGALVLGENPRIGQTMRFHVRDARSADDDLRAALRDARGRMGAAWPAGALLFSCNGRGTRMFAEPNHDANAVSEELSEIPVAGLFCNGEIGPVRGRSFLHGHTATMVVFTDA